MDKVFFWGLLLLFLSSCQEQKSGQASQTHNNEQIQEDPVTPLGTIEEKSLRAIDHLNTPKDSVPIILVHGFIGFGRDEMLGYRYWGGLIDLQEELIKAGYPTFTASVGPVSSNYDRAIELYYQIKGGCVNYGEAHASKFGHAKEVGKCYTGFYPQWDATHPVHLIGHSQGGQTVRTLVALLENGFAAEKVKLKHAALFDGQRYKWVKSVTTIATPNDGTSLTGVIKDFTPFIQSGISTLTSLSGLKSKTNAVYDFDYTGQSVEKGIWYNKPLYNGYDHYDIIGMSLFTDVKPLYLNHVGLIASLPR